MHRIKKTIANLRGYLGRDEGGLQLLSEVEIIANSMRKQSTLKNEWADRAVEQMNLSTNALRDAKYKIRKLEEELQQEQRIRSQRERDVKTWKREADKLQKELDIVLGFDESLPLKTESVDFINTLRSLRSAVKQIRRQSRLCPKPTRIIVPKPTDPYDKYYVYELADIIKKLSDTEFTTLGRLVAVFAIMGFPCLIIESSREFLCKGNGQLKGEKVDNIVNSFIEWFRSNINYDPTASMNGTPVKVGNELPPIGLS